MNFGEDSFEAKILNTGEVVHDMLDFIKIAGQYVQGIGMKGKHKVVIKNNRLHYEFEIKRNGYEL